MSTAKVEEEPVYLFHVHVHTQATEIEVEEEFIFPRQLVPAFTVIGIAQRSRKELHWGDLNTTRKLVSCNSFLVAEE